MSAKNHTLIFDGNCHFCRIWIERWREDLVEDIEVIAYQELDDRFSEIPRSEFSKAIFFIEEEKRVFQGAGALFRALFLSERKWPWRLYSKIPFLSNLLEFCYRFVAKRRYVFSKLTRIFVGKDVRKPRFCITRKLFLKGLFLTYLISFLSLWGQVPGLVGENGIVPITEQVQDFKNIESVTKYLWKPSLVWASPTDVMLVSLMAFGIVFSILGLLGIYESLIALFLWVAYLSVAQFGGPFLRFQWDALLLEMGVLAIFWRPNSNGIVFLYRFLLFRLMFSSGLVKVISEDPRWSEWTALNFHYWTQPLPNPLSYYLDKLPEWIDKLAVGLVFFVELIVPFFIFLGTRLRMLAFYIFVSFQLMLVLSGNYAFFNFLTCVLCLALLNDSILRNFNFLGLRVRLPRLRMPKMLGLFWNKGLWACGGVVFYLGLARIMMPLFSVDLIPHRLKQFNAMTENAHIVNSYGLFAIMTTKRLELIVEGSNDGKIWKSYSFKYKVNSLGDDLHFVAPYHPRLDWQIWFAALRRFEQTPWLQRFSRNLLLGNESVLDLLKDNPFPKDPPDMLRIRLDLISFDHESANIWKSEGDIYFTPNMYLGPNKELKFF